MILPAYFDHAATTPLLPEVLNAMMPYLTESYGNASSRHHAYGWLVEAAIEDSKTQILSCFQATNAQIVFTSGATEAINTVLFGFANKNPKGQIISLKTEHKATLACLDNLEEKGYQVSYLPVDQDGNFDFIDLEKTINAHPGLTLFSFLWVNNETGLVHPIEKIAALKANLSFEMHVDASQAVGKMPIQFKKLGIDYLTYSAHKIYGPKGIGAILSKNRISKMMFGGGQQSDQRGGTLNTPAIVGLAAATQIATDKIAAYIMHTGSLQTLFENALQEHLDVFQIHSKTSQRVSNITSLAISGTDSELILRQLAPKFALANGSACNAASTLPSHVLKAMGFSDEHAYSTIRISFGWQNTEEQVDEFVKMIHQILSQK